MPAVLPIIDQDTKNRKQLKLSQSNQFLTFLSSKPVKLVKGAFHAKKDMINVIAFGAADASRVYALVNPWLRVCYGPSSVLVVLCTAAGIFGITVKAIELTAAKHKTNKKLAYISKFLNSADQLNKLCSDQAFLTSMFRMILSFFSGPDYESNQLKILVSSSLLALGPAGVIRCAHYKRALGKIEFSYNPHLITRLISLTASAASCTAGFTAVLYQQGIIGLALPNILILVTGIIGFLTALAENSLPRLALLMTSLLLVLGSNLSVVASLFSLLSNLADGLEIEEYADAINIILAVSLYVILDIASVNKSIRELNYINNRVSDESTPLLEDVNQTDESSVLSLSFFTRSVTEYCTTPVGFMPDL